MRRSRNVNQETVPFSRIKQGEFFRTTRAPKRLYQKYDGALAQVMAGSCLGETDVFEYKQVIPVTAEITVNV
jgi:hypothetical protein